jgi:hypothetical protein
MDGRISITSTRRFTAFTLDLPPGPAEPPPIVVNETTGARV